MFEISQRLIIDTLHADSQSFREAYFGEGSQQQAILLDNVRCRGDEQRLVDCPAVYEHNCNVDHTEDAGVRCEPSK